MFNYKKYTRPEKVHKRDRRWPDNTISKAPQWCSVDLRDGNQALIEPMSVQQKITMFELLVDIGFTEIEIGFPSASQTDFDFTRYLIDNNKIPDNVTIQVLVQAREHLIKRTYEALAGIPRAIVHVYNSTSVIQRERVFNKTKGEIKNIAIQGAQRVMDYAKAYPETDWTFQYSPESFTQTEIDYALEVCDAVMALWQPTPDKKAIINLPATVEVTSPNEFADRIEWFADNSVYRDAMVLSVHTHNDRGCAVAAGELAVLAGADRVEGTLLGNGERTGNMDIITMAMNLYSHGIDPELNLTDLKRIFDVYQYCCNLPIPERHPWVGSLVYTAFSGSHQDAIKKCMHQQKPNETWQVAYLPINPQDLGRDYEKIIIVNSQSGKGGVQWVLQQNYGIELPRNMLIEFSQVVQAYTDEHQCIANKDIIWQLFENTYMNHDWHIDNIQLVNHQGTDQLTVHGEYQSETVAIVCQGEGMLNAWLSALEQRNACSIKVNNLNQYSQTQGNDSQAIAILEAEVNGLKRYAVGIDQDTAKSPLLAACALLNTSVTANPK